MAIYTLRSERGDDQTNIFLEPETSQEDIKMKNKLFLRPRLSLAVLMTAVFSHRGCVGQL